MTVYRVVQGSWELRFTIPAGWTSPSLAVKVREDFSLRDGDSLLDVFVVLLSLVAFLLSPFFIWSWTCCRGGTGRVVASIYGTGRLVMDVLFPWYGRIDSTWYVTTATQLSNQHNNFEAVLVCSFGSSSAFWA